jgi:thioesterase domain-containing protein/acyl carrier protein
MKQPKSETPSLLEEGFHKKAETGDLCATSPQNPSKSEEASAEFWQAIKTIMALQNQAGPLQPRAQNTDLPLSFAQERLWFLNQLKPKSSAYNIPLALHLTGSLKVSALEQSLNEILRRHETLRTTFAVVEGQPVGVIASSRTLTLPVVDLREIPPEQRESETLRLATSEAMRPFDLNCGSLLRASLLQLGEQEYVVLVTLHQIVFDGWSQGVLLRELAALYEAFSTGKPSPLPSLPIQYADFAIWQRRSLQGEILDALLSYWKQQLGDSLPTQQLPTDRPPPLVPTRRSAQQTLVLPKTLTEALKALSRQEGATLFATLLAAFKILLYRYTAQENLFVCTPTANRNRSQVKGLIGYFVNLLVLRTDLSGNPSFRELLGRVRSCASGANAHQDLPIQQLVNSLNLGHMPLSQVMFVLQNFPKQQVLLPGLTVSVLEIDNGTADFDLSLSMVEGTEELTGVLKYNTDLFDHTTITQMLGHFQSLLEALVANPMQPISSLLPSLGDRSLAAAPGQERRELAREFVAPRNMLEFQLTEIWQKVLGIQSISVRDNFFDLGGNSLLAVRLFEQIEKVFNKNIPSAVIFQAPTIEQLTDILCKEGWSASSSSFVVIKAGGSKPPLFFLHVLGEGLEFCKPLARYLDPEQPIYGLAVGIMDEASASKVEDASEHYLQEMRIIQPEGPYFLAGIYCGGRVAYDMAEKLRVQGQKVALVALLNTLKDVTASKIMSVRERVFAHWHNFLRLGPGYLFRKIQIEPIKNWLMSIYCKFYERMGLPLPQAGQDFIYKKEKKQGNAEWVFTPKQIYQGRVALFRALDEIAFYDADLGWGNMTPGGLDFHDVPGNNEMMFQEPHVQVLAEKLKACIDQALAEEGDVDFS